MFILGCPNLIVATDHKPLLNIFNDRPFDQIENPRTQELKGRSLMYKFKIVHVEGKKHIAPDVLSRNPVHESPLPISTIEQGLASTAKANFFKDSDTNAITWDRVMEAAGTSEECIMLVETIEQGFPTSRDELPDIIRKYWPMRESLYTI